MSLNFRYTIICMCPKESYLTALAYVFYPHTGADNINFPGLLWGVKTVVDIKFPGTWEAAVAISTSFTTSTHTHCSLGHSEVNIKSSLYTDIKPQF